MLIAPDHEDDNDAKDNPTGGRHEKLQVRKAGILRTKSVYPHRVRPYGGNGAGVILGKSREIKKTPSLNPGSLSQTAIRGKGGSRPANTPK
jgi:hypothetical protein